MADGDYYASYADVQHLLMNAGIGVANASLFDDDALETALKITQADIHMELQIDTLTSITQVVYKEVLKGIQTQLIMQWIILARHTQENNLASSDILTTFWSVSPTLTFAQQGKIATIKTRLSPGVYNHDIRTGGRL